MIRLRKQTSESHEGLENTKPFKIYFENSFQKSFLPPHKNMKISVWAIAETVYPCVDTMTEVDSDTVEEGNTSSTRLLGWSVISIRDRTNY